jgi:hypothetical protein
MNRMKFKIYIFSLLILIFSAPILFGQIQYFESQTKEIDQLVKEEEKISKQIDKRLSDLKKKTSEITKIKSKNSENILTNRKLQNLLSDSKEIANELDNLEERKNQLNISINNNCTELVNLLDSELVVIFRKTKSSDRNSKLYKNGLKELTDLYQLRSDYIKYIDQSDYSIRLIPIELTQEETKESLKSKLDLLRDQEDYLSSINVIIKEKLSKSEEWSNLTYLAGDLIEDIQVQQNQDETLVTSNALLSAVTLETGPESQDSRYSNEAFSTNEILIPVEFDNIYQLDREQLQEQIKKLEQFQLLIKTKVDSLSYIINKNR